MHRLNAEQRNLEKKKLNLLAQRSWLLLIKQRVQFEGDTDTIKNLQEWVVND